jgi:hypothetical protein
MSTGWKKLAMTSIWATKAPDMKRLFLAALACMTLTPSPFFNAFPLIRR